MNILENTIVCFFLGTLVVFVREINFFETKGDLVYCLGGTSVGLGERNFPQGTLTSDFWAQYVNIYYNLCLCVRKTLQGQQKVDVDRSGIC